MDVLFDLSPAFDRRATVGSSSPHAEVAAAARALDVSAPLLAPQGQDTSIQYNSPSGKPAPPAEAPATTSGTQQPSAPAAPDMTEACVKQLPFFVPLLLLLYFLMIRPQQKQEKAKREMLGKIQRGDRVVTTSGMHAVVAGVTQDTLNLVIDSEGKVKVTVDRAAIARVLASDTAATKTEGGKTNGTGN